MSLLNNNGFKMSAISLIALSTLPAGDALALKRRGFLTKWFYNAQSYAVTDDQLASDNRQCYGNNGDSSKQKTLAAVQKDGLELQSAPWEHRNDFDVVKAALKQNPLALAYASPELRRNLGQNREVMKVYKEHMRAAVKQNALALEFASAELLEDEEFVFKAIDDNVDRIRRANDKSVSALHVIPTRPYIDMLQHVSMKLRNRYGFMERIISIFKGDVYNKQAYEQVVLRYAGKDAMLKFVEGGFHGLTLQYASQKMRADPDVVLAAVKKNGLALEFASENLQNNEEVVRAAVERDGRDVLRYAGKEAILKFVKEDGSNLRYASKELCEDRDVVMAAVGQDGLAETEQLKPVLSVDETEYPEPLLRAAETE